MPWHEDDTCKSSFFEKRIQYRLPLFQSVVIVQWSNSLILLAKGFNTFQVLTLRPPLFSANYLRILPVNLFCTSGRVFCEASIASVHSCCCFFHLSCIDILLCQSHLVAIDIPSFGFPISDLFHLCMHVCDIYMGCCIQFVCFCLLEEFLLLLLNLSLSFQSCLQPWNCVVVRFCWIVEWSLECFFSL